ncbi:MAG: hypothetical protein OXH09_12825 [Gammaproteobacteria bacterium]|nr:hypothetical protein [Gammaproteobacteria bacterium]
MHPVSPDQVSAGNAVAVENEMPTTAGHADKLATEPNLRAGTASLVGQELHQFRRVGSEEVIAVAAQFHMAMAGCIETNTVYLAHQRCRCGPFRLRFLDEYARGVDVPARRRLLIDHQHGEPPFGSTSGASQSGEPGTDH